MQGVMLLVPHTGTALLGLTSRLAALHISSFKENQASFFL